MRFFFLLIIALSLKGFAESPNWALDDVDKGWNEDALVRLYFHNSELQRQWAWQILGEYSLSGEEHILDFGCGDGKITAEISRLLSIGTITGVDISSRMLKVAKIKFPPYAYPNLLFLKTDSLTFSDFSLEKQYDVICSFCVFHLVADPLEILKNLKKHLKQEGKLLLLIPAGKNPEFFQAANEMFSKYNLEAPWKKASAPQNKTMRTLEGCRTYLEEAGYEILSMKMVDTDNPFYDKEELIVWMMGNTTANWNIPFSISRSFFSDLVERMSLLDPNLIDEEGRIHFKLSRIHLTATPF